VSFHTSKIPIGDHVRHSTLSHGAPFDVQSPFLPVGAGTKLGAHLHFGILVTRHIM